MAVPERTVTVRTDFEEKSRWSNGGIGQLLLVMRVVINKKRNGWMNREGEGKERARRGLLYSLVE